MRASAKSGEGRVEPLTRGQFRVALAQGQAEVDEAQRLRHLAFRTARGQAPGQGPQAGRDSDAYDAAARHLLVRCERGGALVACCRVQMFTGASLGGSYAAQFYDLAPLARFPGPMLELGRFCLHPEWHDPDILRLAWAGLTRLVDAAQVGLLFGCSSFDGADPARHAAALAGLRGRIGPDCWRPVARAPQVLALADLPQGPGPGGPLPPLLRTYLLMGGWVSDHAVIDHDLDTLHVLTAVEVARIPPARAEALRAIAAG